MDIRMYNCSFGDCFRLGSEVQTENSLFVDCGIHSLSAKKMVRECTFDTISKDMKMKSDFLLTHYHADHYNGIVYMINNEKGVRFDNVYIPDVWHLPRSIEYVRLILLQDLLSRESINSDISLFDFLESICHMGSCIHFVRTGDSIQNQYTALWPNFELLLPFFVDGIQDDNDKSKNRYEGDDDKAGFAKKCKLNNPSGRNDNRDNGDIREEWNKLTMITEQLVNLVQEIRPIPMETNWQLREKLSQLMAIKQEFVKLRAEIFRDDALQKRLSRWGNDISIVFHSKGFMSRKVLFTGDVSRKYWEHIYISQQSDKSAEYYNENGGLSYSVIKVPHHGTAPYFFDDINKMILEDETILLISNGDMRRWSISYKYSVLANTYNCEVICANNNNCEACMNERCNSNKRKIIKNHGFYVDF